MEKTNAEESTTRGMVELKINHVFPESTKTIYSNQMVVQHSPDGEFYIYFFEVKPPFIFGDPSEIEAQFKALSSINAECVAKIVVRAEKLPPFIAALAQNYSSFSEDAKDVQNLDDKKGKHAG